ncbi:MAG: class I SAM-dependent methyltransferase [Actinobacteria bacterium]|nr:class I SAM-dependent methyltransferase [Actinomycetota bacterium]MCB9411303.1 class I SAM-dependent methyltransferase [Actinomycetota bacterium]
MTDESQTPDGTPRVAGVQRMIDAMTPPSPTVVSVLTLLVAGQAAQAVPLVRESDDEWDDALRDRLADALTSGDAPARIAERVGDELRSLGPALNPDVIECYRAAFYLGRDWEEYSHNPLYSRFTANKAWQPFDKWIHYFDVYAATLARYVGKPVKVLEIGVFHGGGLDQLRYLLGPQAELVGVDIGAESAAVCADRFEVLIGDQTDPEFLARLVAEQGPFDVIIDDGGHSMRQQITAIEHLFGALNDGGVYIVEDTHTSYWEPYQDHPESFMEWVKARVDDLNAYHHSRDADLGQWTRRVTGIHVYDSMVVLDAGRHLPPFCEVVGTGSFVAADRISESMLLAYRGALAGAESETELFRTDRRLVDEDRSRIAAAAEAQRVEYDARIAALQAERDAALAQAAQAQADLAEVAESVSWKVTKPLRRMKPGGAEGGPRP